MPSPELCETLGSNVLTRVLNASQKVGNKLVDGALVLHGSRNALSNFNLIALTVRREESWSECCDAYSHSTRATVERGYCDCIVLLLLLFFLEG